MPRAATNSDAFNAIAEPQRRRILTLLAGGERSVNDVAAALGLSQPLVSKHLRVLKEVDLVRVREDGRRRLYRLDGQGLKPVHDWVSTFERFWQATFDRLEEYLKETQAKEKNDGQ